MMCQRSGRPPTSTIGFGRCRSPRRAACRGPRPGSRPSSGQARRVLPRHDHLRCFCRRHRVATYRSPRRTYHRRMAARRALITGIGGQDGSYLSELLARRRVRGPRRRPAPPGGSGTLHSADRDRVIDRRGRPPRPGVARRRTCGRRARTRSSTSLRRRSCRVHGTSRCGPPSSPPSVSRRCSRPSGRSIRPSASTRPPPARSSATRPDSPQSEDTPLRPVTPYGVAKAYGHFIAAQLSAPLRHVR